MLNIKKSEARVKIAIRKESYLPHKKFEHVDAGSRARALKQKMPTSQYTIEYYTRKTLQLQNYPHICGSKQVSPRSHANFSMAKISQAFYLERKLSFVIVN